MTQSLFHFTGGDNGLWKVVDQRAVVGQALAAVTHLRIDPGAAPNKAGIWSLAGVVSNMRYTERAEKDSLTARQAELGRTEATCAALIPIVKTEAWWTLTQDERRSLFEAQSHHIQIGMRYLPAIARRLYHCRDLGEPFDFLTWFEYAPADADLFEELVAKLRQTDEWTYVSREIDIRLVKA